MKMAKKFNTHAGENGLSVAIAELTGDVADTWAGAVGTAVEDTLSGEFELGDALTIGGTAIGANAVMSAIGWPSLSASAIIGAVRWPLIGAGLIAGKISWGEFKSGDLIGAMQWSTVSGAAIAAAIPFATVSGGAVVGAIVWPTISAGQILDKIAGGGDVDNPFKDAGEDFAEDNPGIASAVTEAVRSSSFYQAGERYSGSEGALDEDDSGDGILEELGGFVGLPTGGAVGFAQGGVARRPTNAVVGEAGPEAVMSLDDLSREIERAIRAGQQGASDSVDMSEVVGQLQTVVRELRRTRQAVEGQDLEVAMESEKFDPF
jgi:hypothetical protein